MSVEYDTNASIDPATDLERRAIRSAFDDVVISGRTAHRDKKFHIPLHSEDDEDTTPLCSKVSGVQQKTIGFRRRPIEVYPPGWHEWCLHCVRVWRIQGGNE